MVGLGASWFFSEQPLEFRLVEGQDREDLSEATADDVVGEVVGEVVGDVAGDAAGEREEGFAGLTTRAGRIASHARNPKWKNPALRIDMSTCINCDTCLRHCPPHFGAIFNHGLDVIIVPELCSGCGKCLPPVCPVDCIVLDPTPDPTPDEWWEYPLSSEDPYH